MRNTAKNENFLMIHHIYISARKDTFDILFYVRYRDRF
jgi:hypothetical protein